MKALTAYGICHDEGPDGARSVVALEILVCIFFFFNPFDTLLSVRKHSSVPLKVAPPYESLTSPAVPDVATVTGSSILFCF